MLSNMVYKILLSISICVFYNSVNSARILGVFPTCGSHYILGNALMKGLAEAGHNVTVISPFEDQKPPKRGSYRSIVLSGFLEQNEEMFKNVNLLEVSNQSFTKFNLNLILEMSQLMDDFFGCQNVQNLIKSNETFDAVIVEQFYSDATKIFGRIYEAPVIAFSTLGPVPWVNPMIGNPFPVSYIPQLNTDFTPHMAFSERLANSFYYLILKALDYWYHFPEQNRVLKKYFPDSPHILDLYQNVALALTNSHESLNQPVPLVPNIVQIGGYHIRPPKSLPEDLRKFLDNSTEGVIYFSMGTNVRTKDLPAAKRVAFLNAFSKLKEKVLWKWEDEDMPGKSQNIKIAKWLPQQDILAHPNVKLFITHSGLLSTTEAVYHGVPVLGIPVFGDQHLNAKLSKYAGYALILPYADPSFSEEKLSELLNELLSNPKYRENVQKGSRIFHDRPMKPMDAAVYWVEYVIRHKGAPHLKVAGVKMSWYIYHSVDVISFIVVVLLLLSFILCIIIRSIFCFLGISINSKSKMKREKD